MRVMEENGATNAMGERELVGQVQALLKNCVGQQVEDTQQIATTRRVATAVLHIRNQLILLLVDPHKAAGGVHAVPTLIVSPGDINVLTALKVLATKKPATMNFVVQDN